MARALLLRQRLYLFKTLENSSTVTLLQLMPGKVTRSPVNQATSNHHRSVFMVKRVARTRAHVYAEYITCGLTGTIGKHIYYYCGGHSERID